MRARVLDRRAAVLAPSSDGDEASKSPRGDICSATVQGRLIALVLMFVGIGFLSLLTAAVASRFVKLERGTSTTK